MKTWLKLSSWLAVSSTAALMVQMARADVVYNNTTNDLTIRFNPGTSEVGDEIILGSGSRVVTQFRFQYWGLNFSSIGTELADVRFYANNGTNSLSGYPVPGTVLFDSGPFYIGSTARQTLIFTDFITGAVVPLTGPLPTDFTWTVQFSGLGPLATAGVDLYGTTTNTFSAGWSYPDYWDNTGNGWWQLRTNNATPINFAAEIITVPEPSVMVFGLLGGLALLALKLRNTRR